MSAGRGTSVTDLGVDGLYVRFMPDRATRSAPAGFDPFSPAYLEDPHGFWEAARQNGGDDVFFYEPMRCWVLTRRADVANALRDWTTFSSRTLRGASLPVEMRNSVPREMWGVPGELMKCAFINLDPPEHTRHRKNAQKAFTRPLVKATEPKVRDLAHQLIDTFAARGECELMGEFAHALTLGVIGHMIGLPQEAMPQFRAWIDDFFGLMVPDTDDAEQEALERMRGEIASRYRRVGEAYAFFKAYLDERRLEPREDLASAMVLATDETGAPAMSYDHILTHLLELAAAGSETTANLIGNMVRLFTARPDLLEQVHAEPESWEKVIEEGLRRAAIINSLLRVTTADVEVKGAQIPAGSSVLLIIAGANSDAKFFSEPLGFDAERTGVTDHLAFGLGRHFCLGAPLARVEARCALQTLYRRLPDLKADLDQELHYNAGITVRGIRELAVSWST